MGQPESHVRRKSCNSHPALSQTCEGVDGPVEVLGTNLEDDAPSHSVMKNLNYVSREKKWRPQSGSPGLVDDPLVHDIVIAEDQIG